jgi:hypothetical protein
LEIANSRHEGCWPVIFREQCSEKQLATMINEVRNWLKHYSKEQDLTFDEKKASAELIDGACTNFFRFPRAETEGMRRFTSAQINTDNANSRRQSRGV